MLFVGEHSKCERIMMVNFHVIMPCACHFCDIVRPTHAITLFGTEPLLYQLRLIGSYVYTVAHSATH